MTRTRFLWPLTLILIVLAACQPRPRVIDLDADPGVFRGLYRAEVDLRVASSAVGFSADGSRMAMANGDGFHTAQLWDVSGGVPTGAVGEDPRAQAVALTPDGLGALALVLSAEYDGPGEVQVWDAATGVGTVRLPGRSPSCADCQAAAFALSPDGATVALLSRRLYGGLENEISLFDVATGARRVVLEAPLPGYADVRFSPDGSKLAAISVPDGYDSRPQTVQVTLWDAGGTPVGTFSQPGGVQRDPHMWGGDAPVVAKLFGDRLELAAVTTGELLHTLPVPPEPNNYPNSLYADAANTRLLGTEESVTLWDLAANRVLVTGTFTEYRYSAAGFSPDGRYALLYDGKALQLSPDTLEPEKTLVNGEVRPLELDAAATFLDGRRYGVAGSLRFGDDAPVPFAGEVMGHESEVYAQMSLPQPAELVASFDYGGRTWELRSSPPFSSATFFPALAPEGSPYSNPYVPGFNFELAKVR